MAATNFDISVGLDGCVLNPRHQKNGYKAAFECWQNKLWEEAKTSYPLYQNISNAEHGITGNILTPTITLTTKPYQAFDKGSLVLYRQFEVGKILSIKPKTNNFDVDIYIYPAYQHLLTDKSRFWVESATRKIDVSQKVLVFKQRHLHVP